ncbi:MAG TPA: hypothetical protein VGP08_25595 [Pyrinomonadaceae bacterium]|jgi:hypothetical protein|nr:hypothetical protein [Pyrinomonadaceae bacterium]
MADPISGIGHSVLSQNLGQEKLQQQGGGGRSFEGVLRQQGAPQEPQGGAQAPEQAEGVSGAKLEQMRLDLMNRVKGLPPGAPNVNALLPELIDTRTRLGMLRDVMGKSHGTPVGTDLRGRFGQVENEWNQVESVMRSNRELSTTELLGLQARLYQVTQHVEVLSKVVDQVTGGIKTILNTNV